SQAGAGFEEGEDPKRHGHGRPERGEQEEGAEAEAEKSRPAVIAKDLGRRLCQGCLPQLWRAEPDPPYLDRRWPEAKGDEPKLIPSPHRSSRRHSSRRRRNRG